MTNATVLLRNKPLRILIVGYPGTGKTGALAPLLDAGFKIRMLDFDGNPDPLIQFAKPESLARLDIAYFEDKMKAGVGFMEPVGIPTAYVNAYKQLDDWKTTNEKGEAISLGFSKEWGLDTIVVVDSLTKLGDACFRRAMKLLNKTPMNVSERVWGLAMSEQAAFIEALTSANNPHHVIVLAHLKMIGPKDMREGDDPLTKELKQLQAEIVPTRLWPSALGRQLPQQIGGEFPVLIEAERITRNNKTTRTLNLAAKELLDTKFPGVMTDTHLPIESGLLRVFEALSPGSVELAKENLANG